ncbi:GntR family transcriptional regulator [Bacillus chungangensis]|uniref:GntR family negative regulator for fad regulon and positive regulator of fabA n=1 Tax=Bacillus chungangensis TaxID=587633 RepID=A0ABT9WVG8_9BACI|nr:GntR family transcriptional regulator [Bacillus chungangensis]MDQ0176760.1 GntR family negative regulator for fad regulon and positive regulator of fabA [Bacillus chungangensis]
MENPSGRKKKISDIVEERMIQDILTKHFQMNKMLPSERELAMYYGTSRPVIREVMRKLERDGWITVRKNSPAMVNNYWETGNLMTLTNIALNSGGLSKDFVTYLLELRAAIAPKYFSEALKKNPKRGIAIFSQLGNIADCEQDYAAFDWHLQKQLAGLIDNPLYLFILNSFDQIYIPFACQYFAYPSHRKLSYSFYTKLLQLLLNDHLHEVETLVQSTMAQTVQLWAEKIQDKEGIT